MYSALKLISGSADDGTGGAFGTSDAGAKSRDGKAGNGAARKVTLLVVEDEILIRMTTADYLRNNGFRVLEASNATEALAVFAAGEPIQLVFTDVDMPGTMDGTALANWIHKYFPDVKVLLTYQLSAAHSARPSAVSTHMEAVLEKPYAHAALLAVVKRLIAV
jgi:CheY-like chemotaxis protein